MLSSCSSLLRPLGHFEPRLEPQMNSMTNMLANEHALLPVCETFMITSTFIVSGFSTSVECQSRGQKVVTFMASAQMKGGS